jgi:hypothetical protein
MDTGDAMKTYLRNWSLYLRGFRWCWTLQGVGITYKPGWGPWRFLIPYCTTYFLGTLCGCGVQSLSRWWYGRSRILWPERPVSRFMTRLLDWAFPGSAHGRHTGKILWNSEDLWG